MSEYDYFPYDIFRKGQKEMFEFIRNNLQNNVISFIHAPTGIGKTASALAPVLKFAEENSKKVFFLTNRHEHHRIVFETIKEINKKYGKNFKAINILNKKLLCNQKIGEIEVGDFHDYCRTLRKDRLCYFYDNTLKNNTLTHQAKISLASFMPNTIISADNIKEYFKEFCPYEIALELIKKSHVVVADYYYLFHPSIKDSFLARINIKPQEIIVIVDEAHNLPERMRMMYDIKISSFILKRAIKESKEHDPMIADMLLTIGMNIEAFLLNKVKKEESQTYLSPNDLYSIIEKEISFHSLIDFLYEIAEKTYLKNTKSYANSIRKFLEFWEVESESIIRIGEITSRDPLYWNLRISDIDISSKIFEIISETGGAVFMSGTLTPLNMYQEIMGVSGISKALHLYSPFPISNHKLFVVRGITTKYEFRNEETYKIYGEVLSLISNNFHNNIIFFFPSYEIRDFIIHYFSPRKYKIILKEEKDITKEEKDAILNTMKEEKDVVLLAITGANFYEGVDFKEDMAEIVGIVGIPFEKPDLYTRAIINYYDKKYKKGMEYGYIIPTLNKTIQSSGRILRSEKDRGIIFLLDERYLYPSYLKHIKERYPIVNTIHYSDLINQIIFLRNFLNKSRKEDAFFS